jgi:pilus assembly protein Flp/PilA
MTANRRLTMKFLNKLIRDEAGATAIEYGLIAALIAVAAITAMNGLGNQLKTTFNTTSSSMSSANAAA